MDTITEKSLRREKEVAMISAVMADFMSDEIYEISKGYMDMLDNIYTYAVEFYQLHLKTNWEDLLHTTTFGKSGKMNQTELLSWEDVIVDFVYLKIESLN